MGSLTLPPAGPVYLDANGFIYSVERIEPYRTLLEPMWQLAQAGQFEVVSSELVILETLVKPLLFTNDGGFRRVPGLPVAALHEVVKQAP